MSLVLESPSLYPYSLVCKLTFHRTIQYSYILRIKLVQWHAFLSPPDETVSTSPRKAYTYFDDAHSYIALWKKSGILLWQCCILIQRVSWYSFIGSTLCHGHLIVQCLLLGSCLHICCTFFGGNKSFFSFSYFTPPHGLLFQPVWVCVQKLG